MNDEEYPFSNNLDYFRRELNSEDLSEINNQNEIRHTTLDLTLFNKTENDSYKNVINFNDNKKNNENIDNNGNNDSNDNNDNNDNIEDFPNENIFNDEKFISKSFNNFNKFSFNDDNSNLNLNDDFFVDNKHNIEQNKMVNENENTNIITLHTGKVINTINKQIRNVINELFKRDEIDYESKNDMQLLKIKKKRRTKSQILNDKTLLQLNFNIKKKNRGRISKNIKKVSDSDSHSKYADDNILKKINTNFIESTRKWINNCFLDKKGNFFLNKKGILKLNPKLIGNINLKKNEVEKLMKMTFKEIFSCDISVRYKKNDTNANLKLIENIYMENKQYFVKFILDLTFIEGYNIYNYQTDINEFLNLFKDKNYNENTIKKFYDKFEKIDVLLKKVYNEEKKDNSKLEDIEDYIDRISILSVNYENWFERKFYRSSNKNKKEK